MRALPEALRQRLRDGGRDLSVLVLRTGAFGDVLRTLPAVRVLRPALPHARILWVVEDRWAGVLHDHPDLDGIVTMPRSSWRSHARSFRAWPSLLRELARWTRELRARNANVALDFHGNLRSGLVGVASGAGVRLGYEGHQQKEGNRWFTTHRVPAGARRISRVERNLALLRPLGIEGGNPAIDAGLFEAPEAAREAREIVRRLAGEGASFAVVSPGASRGQAYKKPPVPLLAEAARCLATRGLTTLVVHGPGELEEAEHVVSAASDAARLAPPTDLAILASLLRLASLFVGGDSGPLHLACAVGCPVVGLYGPTDPVVNAPWGVPHVAVSPPGRVYTGIKRLDRNAGGFDGLVPNLVRDAVDRMLPSILAARRTP